MWLNVAFPYRIGLDSACISTYVWGRASRAFGFGIWGLGSRSAASRVLAPRRPTLRGFGVGIAGRGAGPEVAPRRPKTATKASRSIQDRDQRPQDRKHRPQERPKIDNIGSRSNLRPPTEGPQAA